ncbi:MAG: phosphotransferase [Planctomycetota bacterium]
MAIDPAELAVVASRYPIGEIEHIRPLASDRPQRAHAALQTDEGRFIVKRRETRDPPRERIMASNRNAWLSELREFGVPAVRPLREFSGEAVTILELDIALEVQPMAHGLRPSDTPEAAAEAGRVLALLHDVPSPVDVTRPGVTTWHDAPTVPASLRSLAAAMPDTRAEVLTLTERYIRAAKRAATAPAKNICPLHGDWHPGNILVDSAGSITAIFDFDQARIGPRTEDIASGALHFMGEIDADPTRALDRLTAFLTAYDQTAAENRKPLHRAERNALPWLMVEALIAEVPSLAARQAGNSSTQRTLLASIDRRAEAIERAAEGIGSIIR